MTIPRLPGPLDWLGQGVSTGLQAYDASKAQQYDQAQTGARLILGLVQAGRLDPQVALQDPAFAQVMKAAKIPLPSPESIVPSVPAEEARQKVGLMRGVQPGSTEQRKMLQFPTLGEISEDDLVAALNEVRQEGAKNPAVARVLAGVLPNQIAEGREAVGSAAFDPAAYLDAADRFVANANGDPVKAKALAQADPQYAELVGTGQLSDEYFAAAARQWALMDEKMKISRMEALNRRAAIDNDYRNFQVQDRSFDTDVQRLLKIMDLNKLSDSESMFIQTARAKRQKDPKAELNSIERASIEKYQKYVNAQLELDNLQNQRAELRGQFGGTKNPPPPSGEIDPAVVTAIKGALRRGEKTPDDIMRSERISEAQKEAILGDKYVKPSARKKP